MADASYSFLPWLRTGMAGEIRAGGSATGTPRADIDITVVVDAAGDSRSATAELSLYGPGEVAGIDRRLVIRTTPKPEEADAEPDLFPTLEFGQPDFPWRYTPAAADVRNRVRPWLVLAVLADGEIGDQEPAGPDGRLPAITVTTAAALPRLDQSWAWAHVQVEGFDPATETLADLLRTQPRRVRSRLIAPRRLHGHTHYTALLVPAFERGRRAGLREPLDESVAGLAPAWQPTATGVRLPVYHRWSFHTGREGDFELLARRLRARRVGPEVGQRDLDARTSDPALPPAATAMLAMDGALLSPTASPGPWDPAHRATFVSALATILNAPADALAAADGPRIVAPPLWARWHAARDRLDPGANARPRWFHELNADPRLRVTAGLGAAVVMHNDESLMAAAWDQLEGVLAANEALRRAQLAREAAVRLHANHLADLDLDTFLQVSATVHARFTASADTVHERLRRSPVPPGALDGQLRRIRRPAGRIVRRGTTAAGGTVAAPPRLLARLNAGDVRARPPVPTPEGALVPGRLIPAAQPTGAEHERETSGVLGTGVDRDRIAALGPPPGWRPGVAAWVLDDGGPVIIHRPVPVGGHPDSDPDTSAAVKRFRSAFEDLVDEVNAPPEPGPVLRPADLAGIGSELLDGMNPEQTIPAGLRHRLAIADWVRFDVEDPLEPIMAAPEFDRPMYEPLCELSQDWLLPGVGAIPQDTVTVVITNQRFIEAYLAGLSHETARELLYHEYPTDQRGTYFRQFWDSRGTLAADGAAPDPQTQRDITPIHGWKGDRLLGNNSARVPAPADDNVVLLVKGEVLRRYPQTMVYAVRAVLGPDGRRTLGTIQRFPVFHGRLDPDITFFGFALRRDEVRGGSGAAANQGWYFVLAEHPTEPRFGLDADNGEYGGRPSRWSDMNWAHLTASEPGLAQLTYINLAAALPDTSGVQPGPGEPPLDWHGADANASDLAWITLQRPFRVAIHGSDMVPPDAP
jgi:hypothetical protein